MTLHGELADLLNRHSVENGSDTPDWILANYLLACLEAWEVATASRRQFYDRSSKVSDRVTRLAPVLDALSDDVLAAVEKILLPSAVAVSRAKEAAAHDPPGIPDEVAAQVEKARLAGCNIEWASSRMCEVGTKGCVVHHGSQAEVP